MKQQLQTKTTLRHVAATLALAALVLFAPSARGQHLADYTFSTGVDATRWITLSDNASVLIPRRQVHVASALTDIGFTFPFGAESHTQFWVNSNGILSFSDSAQTDSISQFYGIHIRACQPKICGASRIMSTGNNGYVKYALTGTAPNRILVCEFCLVAGHNIGGNAMFKWQVQLHEATSSVVLVYAPCSQSMSSFQIGLGESFTDSWVIYPSNHEATHITGPVARYNGWPDANRYYEFSRPFTTEANNWYAISSPKHDNGQAYQSLSNIGGLLPTGTQFAHDLFRYDEATSTWENYTVRTDAMTFEQARGYIYRRSNDGFLTFEGDSNMGNISISLTASASGDLQGFNLVGNPYTHIYMMNERCYSLTTDGSWEVHNSNYMLKIAEAVMVKVDEPGTLTFTEFSKGSRSAAPAMAFTVKGGGMQDVAYATLTEGNGMPKLGHLNEAAPVLSIPVEGRRYAIADLGDECESFNMAFRGQEGEYTLTFNSQLSILNYCHLIDKVNGNEIDLLSNPTYTFTHSNTQTMSDRFMVKLTPNVEENTTGHFAYWNGSAWVVEGTGTLEVYDILGRMVSRQTLNSQLSTLNSHQFPSTGVYVLRMGGKNQKIVVK